MANAFVSRRYSYEVDFFKGILQSPVFLSIMLLITVLQVIIMQTPISFIFKVRAQARRQALLATAAAASMPRRRSVGDAVPTEANALSS